MQKEFDDDDIGNRISALWGVDAAGNNLRTEFYSANALNQSTGSSHPRYFPVD